MPCHWELFMDLLDRNGNLLARENDSVTFFLEPCMPFLFADCIFGPMAACPAFLVCDVKPGQLSTTYKFRP
jgi:hypothetical protein